MENLGKILEVFSAKRLWLFSAICGASAFLIFAPDIGPLVLSKVREKYLVFLVITLVISSALAISAAVSDLVDRLFRPTSGTPKIRITPDVQQGVWGVVLQKDGKYTTQYGIQINIYNGSDGPIQIVRTRIVWPPFLGQHVAVANTIVGATGSGSVGVTYDRRHMVPSGATIRGGVNVLLSGKHGGRGSRTYARFSLQDQTGREHRFGLWIKDPNAAARRRQ